MRDCTDFVFVSRGISADHKHFIRQIGIQISLQQNSQFYLLTFIRIYAIVCVQMELHDYSI